MKGRWPYLLAVIGGCITLAVAFYERHERAALNARGVTTTGRVESAWTTQKLTKKPERLMVEYHVDGKRYVCSVEDLPSDFLERAPLDLRSPVQPFGTRMDPGPLTVRYLPDDPSTARVEHPRLPLPKYRFQGWDDWALAGLMIIGGICALFEKRSPAPPISGVPPRARR